MSMAKDVNHELFSFIMVFNAVNILEVLLHSHIAFLIAKGAWGVLSDSQLLLYLKTLIAASLDFKFNLVELF